MNNKTYDMFIDLPLTFLLSGTHIDNLGKA